MKKFLAFFLALVLVLGLCACGGGMTNDDDGELTADGKVKLSIGIGTNALIMSHDNNALTKWIEEECGVELTFIEFAGGTDITTQITTTISANQELPDILFGMNLGSTSANRYGRDGYFVDLTPYYEDKEGASKIFWDRMENELSEYDQDLVLRKITDIESGKIFGVPCVETSLYDKIPFQTWINVQWLDKLGLEKPTNNDELLKVLKAFKTGDPNGNGVADEIPLLGSQKGGLSSNPVDWLINLFTYYNRNRPFNVDENGKLTAAYTSDEYREGLKFVNMLREEGLLTTLAWTASNQELKTIFTPSTGTALAGVVLGHLTQTTSNGNEVLYQYEPMQTWGCAYRNDTSVNMTVFITEDCGNPDKAFEVLMKLWSWEGSMRVRYGEYGVNWTDPDEGALSESGLPATFKILDDPLGKQSTAKWAKIASTLNIMAEGELAQLADNLSEWQKVKNKLHAESSKLFDEAGERNNPKNICPPLEYTQEETETYDKWRGNVSDRYAKAQTEFCSGVLDPNSDADWNAYLKELNDLGLDKVIELAQIAYDRS